MSFKNSISDILGYAARGWRVYPIHTITNGACSCPARAACKHAGKHPVTANGFHDATTDEATIRQWATTLPGANVGIATGEGSGLLVLDIDGSLGRESLARLEREHGPLPDTPRVQTGRTDGGVQHYFAYPAGTRRGSGTVRKERIPPTRFRSWRPPGRKERMARPKPHRVLSFLPRTKRCATPTWSGAASTTSAATPSTTHSATWGRSSFGLKPVA